MSTDPIHPHITDEMLADYALGGLSAELRAQIRDAVASSPPAAAKLTTIRLAADALASAKLHEPPAELVQRALRLVRTPAAQGGSWLTRAADVAARILFDSFAAPAPAGLRSAGLSEARHMTFDSDVGEIDLEVRPAGPGVFVVTGQLASAGEGDSEIGYGRADSQDPKAIAIDASGRFDFQIGRGEWEFRLRVGERICALPRIHTG